MMICEEVGDRRLWMWQGLLLVQLTLPFCLCMRVAIHRFTVTLDSLLFALWRGKMYVPFYLYLNSEIHHRDGPRDHGQDG